MSRYLRKNCVLFKNLTASSSVPKIFCRQKLHEHLQRFHTNNQLWLKALTRLITKFAFQNYHISSFYHKKKLKIVRRQRKLTPWSIDDVTLLVWKMKKKQFEFRCESSQKAALRLPKNIMIQIARRIKDVGQIVRGQCEGT